MNWDDFRIANQVAISGTLTAAGEALGVNHATVLRHINRLEESLDTKLFIRHQRGYQLTEAGRLMQATLPKIQSQINQLADDISLTESTLNGVITLTTVSDFALLLNPALKKFQEAYPDIRIKILATDDRVPLETGEIHVSLRMAANVEEPDLIGHKIRPLDVQLWASQDYIDQYGVPKSEAEYAQHKWVLPLGKKRNINYIKHLLSIIPPEQLVYQSNSFRDIHSAIYEGMGIGPVTETHPSMMQGLVPLPIPLAQPEVSYIWFIYHKNIKHNQRLQALLAFLKEHL